MVRSMGASTVELVEGEVLVEGDVSVVVGPAVSIVDGGTAAVGADPGCPLQATTVSATTSQTCGRTVNEDMLGFLPLLRFNL